MLDMGFIPDIERIFKMTPFTRQTLFFSATMPPEITRLTQEFLSNPTRIEVARASSASENITQSLVSIGAGRKDGLAKAKRDGLRAILSDEGEAVTNAIIFCNRKRDIGILEKSLIKHGHSVGSLHGDLDQRVRMATLDDFRENRITLLVASDVAARGLDIPAVSHVFNFDVPTHSEDYVHRIGRTGRAGEIPRMELPGNTAAQAHAEAVATEDEKPKRSRTRRGSRSKSNEFDVTIDAAVETETSEDAPAKQERAATGKKSSEPHRGRGRDRGERGPRVKGLGDHMPAFMLIPIPDLSKASTVDDDSVEELDAA